MHVEQLRTLDTVNKSRDLVDKPFSSAVIFSDKTTMRVAVREAKKVAIVERVDAETEQKAAILNIYSLYKATPIKGKENELRKIIYNCAYAQQSIDIPIITIPELFNTEEWNNLKDYYHPNGASVVTCAKEYKESNQRYRYSVAGSCGVSSMSFFDLLKKRNVITDEMVKSGYAKIEKIYFGSDNQDGREYHSAVRLGNLVIDWTYSQYDKQAPFPYCYILKNGENLRAKIPVKN